MLREDRLDMLEQRTEALAERLRRLEGEIGAKPTVTSAAPARPRMVEPAPERVPVARPRPEVRIPPPRPQQQKVAMEDLLGGRVLAWLGGIAVLVGIAFFFALAVSHGWIGP